MRDCRLCNIEFVGSIDNFLKNDYKIATHVDVAHRERRCDASRPQRQLQSQDSVATLTQEFI